MAWTFRIQFGSDSREWRDGYRPTDEEILRVVHAMYEFEYLKNPDHPNLYRPTDEEILRVVHAMYEFEYLKNPDHPNFGVDKERVRQAIEDKSPEIPDDAWNAVKDMEVPEWPR